MLSERPWEYPALGEQSLADALDELEARRTYDDVKSWEYIEELEQKTEALEAAINELAMQFDLSVLLTPRCYMQLHKVFPNVG